MELTLSRRIYTAEATTGELLIDGKHQCYTVEDHYPTPYVKTAGVTAIPEGRYQVTVERSPRFSARAGKDVLLPRLHGVPGFSGVLIHSGNTAADSEGCILVGRKLGINRVDESRLAMADLQPKLQAAQDRGEKIFITVQRGA